MLKIVQENKDEYVQFMKDLVSIDSQPGQEEDVANFILNEFKKMGVDEAFIDGAGNVVAILRGEGTGANIMMNGHMDIVPPGSLENWAPYDPFKPEIVDGKLIGRGICGMKGGLAAAIFAFKAIVERVIKTGKKLPGDLIFSGVVLEEPAEMFGMEYFFDYTMKEHDIKCDVVLLGEPTGNDVWIGQRGKVELVVRTYGRCAHSSAPHQGVSALEHMVPIMDAIFKHKGIDCKVDFIGTVTPITITNCIVKPGGNLSIIPDYCEISIDRRYTTDQSLEDLLAEFEAIFAELKKEYPEFNATVEPRYYEERAFTGYTKKVKKYHPPWRVPSDNEYVQKTFKALRSVGQDPKEGYWPGGTDGSMTCGIHGIPTIGYSGADVQQAHQPQEHVLVDEMVKTYEGYVAIVAEIFGLDLALFN